VASLTMEQANAAGETLAGMQQMNSDMSSVFTNVPQGFKLARERFEAIIPGMGNAGVPGQSTNDSSLATGGISIEKLFVFADDSAEFVSSMENAARQERQRQTGSSNGEQQRTGGSI
jgi:hypothetical protein